MQTHVSEPPSSVLSSCPEHDAAMFVVAFAGRLESFAHGYLLGQTLGHRRAALAAAPEGEKSAHAAGVAEVERERAEYVGQLEEARERHAAREREFAEQWRREGARRHGKD